MALSAEDEGNLDATIEKIVESHGYVSNLMQTLALAPDGLAAFAALNRYTSFQSQLTQAQRELAILIGGRDTHYCRAHHEPLAQAAGVTSEQLLLIRENRVPRDLGPAEQALCAYAFEIAAVRRPPPRVAEAVRASFSVRQIVDIALLTSYAMAVAGLTMGLDVEIESAETLQFEFAWSQKNGAS